MIHRNFGSFGQIDEVCVHIILSLVFWALWKINWKLRSFPGCVNEMLWKEMKGACECCETEWVERHWKFVLVSYGSLDKQLQNGVSPVQTVRKLFKMLKEKEKLFHWICKFAGRKKVGMLFLCVISAAIFVWVLCVGKGIKFLPLSLILHHFCHWIMKL